MDRRFHVNVLFERVVAAFLKTDTTISPGMDNDRAQGSKTALYSLPSFAFRPFNSVSFLAKPNAIFSTFAFLLVS